MASGGSLDKARSYLDSGLVILDKALLYDPENVIALQKKAEYCEKIGEYQEAERLYDQLSEFGELGYEYYHGEVMKFPHIKNYYGAIDSYLKYLKQKPKQLIVSQYMLRKIMAIFRETGFPELEKQMARHLFEFSSDSALLYRYMISAELYQERFDPALEYALEGNRLDPANYIFTDLIALCYAYQEDFKMAFNYTVLIEDTAEKRGPVVRPGYIPGYIYLMNGYEAQADYHFKKEIARRLKEIEYARPQAQQCESHLYLAGTFLALGNEVKALDYLKQLKSLKAINYGHIMMLTRWPGFESIRNTPEYLDVLKNLNSKYLHQHQRIQVLIDKADLDPSLN
jgi:tetratricopeptide (TPR) repeat protein